MRFTLYNIRCIIIYRTRGVALAIACTLHCKRIWEIGLAPLTRRTYAATQTPTEQWRPAAVVVYTYYYTIYIYIIILLCIHRRPITITTAWATAVITSLRIKRDEYTHTHAYYLYIYSVCIHYLCDVYIWNSPVGFGFGTEWCVPNVVAVPCVIYIKIRIIK